MTNSFRLAALIACHNRADSTVAALTGLHEVVVAGFPDIDLTVYLVDDGSTDGTGARVTALFDKVRVIRGNGNLFWNGGMCLAYDASRVNAPFDGYLLLNDDVQLIVPSAADALSTFIAEARGDSTVLVGATVSAVDGRVTYSGFRQPDRRRPLRLELITDLSDNPPCDTFNGNFVLIEGRLFERIGGLDPSYRHSLGDIDLGLVARNAGVQAHVYSDPIGVCERGAPIEARLRGMTLAQRFRQQFASPHGIGPYAHFVAKHCSRPRATFLVAQNAVRRLGLAAIPR